MLTALANIVKNRREERFKQDQACARELGDFDSAAYAPARETLEKAIENRTHPLSDETRALLRDDLVLAKPQTATAYHQALEMMCQDPVVQQVAEAGLYRRGQLASDKSSENRFVKHIQLMGWAMGLESAQSKSVAPFETVRAAQMLMIHDLLEPSQRADYLDTVAAVGVGMNRVEADIRALMRLR